MSNSAHVYKLSLTEKVIQLLHATLGFPSKATSATFPGFTADNINIFFLDADEAQKGEYEATASEYKMYKTLSND